MAAADFCWLEDSWKWLGWIAGFSSLFVWKRCPIPLFCLFIKKLILSRHISCWLWISIQLLTAKPQLNPSQPQSTRLLTSLHPLFFCQPWIFTFLIYHCQDPFYPICFKPYRVTQTCIPNPSLESLEVQTSSHQLHFPIPLLQWLPSPDQNPQNRRRQPPDLRQRNRQDKRLN